MSLTEKTFDTGELRLRYAENDISGPPLVLLHGLTGRWNAYEPLIPAFSPPWHVYAVDLRGHGDSDRGDDYLLTSYARDIHAFLTNVVPEPAVLLGHSLGALTALATADRMGSRLRALVLVDPPLFTYNMSIKKVPEAYGWFQFVYDTVTAAQSLEDVVARCRTMMPDVPEAGLRETAGNIAKVAPGTVQTALQDRLLEGFGMESALRQVACPSLLMYGDWDKGAVVRDADVDLVRNNLPGVQLIHIPNGTHLFLWDATATAMPPLLAFLKTV
jgi:pimeloyl-ACP methyl ester carboxylesterase